MNNIAIFPYCGNGLEVLDALGEIQGGEIIFLTDDENYIGTKYQNIDIISRKEYLANNQTKLIAVHGSAKSYCQRLNVIKQLESENSINWETIIHPSAQISKYSKIGHNVFISAGVVIGPNVIIEDHVIILANSVIHHDSVIKSGSIICGNVLIAGNVIIHEEVYIGAGACVKDSIEIQTKAQAGIGSVILKNIPKNEVWVGNPAKLLIKK